MDKEQVVKVLETLSDNGCQIAEVICDITTKVDLTPCYPNESILVLLTKETDKRDLVNPCKHWTLCESIKDFKDGIVYGVEEAEATRCRYYVCDFKEVKPFNVSFKLLKI